ncbi:MAG: DUF6624 domain-containing protein [Dokdonella sp.]
MRAVVEVRVMVWLLVVVAVMPLRLTAAAPDDATLFRHCPGLAAWVAAKRKIEEKTVIPPTPEIAPSAPQLRQDLLNMARQDQDARNSLDIRHQGPDDPAVQKMFRIDAANLRRIKIIVSKYGFPTRALVGGDGVAAAWLLAQHADADPEFQSSVLEQIDVPSRRNEIGGDLIALLTDRVLLAAGKPQRYGTQFSINGDAQELRPTEDLDHLDERRAKLGLYPMSVYECLVREQYHTH